MTTRIVNVRGNVTIDVSKETDFLNDLENLAKKYSIPIVIDRLHINSYVDLGT